MVYFSSKNTWSQRKDTNVVNADVIIDFSNRENIKYIYEYAKRNKIKVVIATTNLKNEDYELLYDLANYVPVMVDSNYSSGITIIKKILYVKINAETKD